MFATKLTLILLGAVLYLSGSACWFFWIGPLLLSTGTTETLLGAFVGTCIWLLISFGFIVHIIKTSRPGAGGGR